MRSILLAPKTQRAKSAGSSPPMAKTSDTYWSDRYAEISAQMITGGGGGGSCTWTSKEELNLRIYVRLHDLYVELRKLHAFFHFHDYCEQPKTNIITGLHSSLMSILKQVFCKCTCFDQHDFPVIVSI